MLYDIVAVCSFVPTNSDYIVYGIFLQYEMASLSFSSRAILLRFDILYNDVHLLL